MRKLFLTLSLAALAPATALAGEHCGTACYERVDQPAQYQTYAETVEVRPARVYARHIPPTYGTVQESVVVTPERRVEHVIPAQYSTVEETVRVAPARQVWQVTRDANGREIGCWVTVPAQYATQYRKVQVAPAQSRWEPLR